MMKKVVIVHTDFRIYWPARLKGLESIAQKQGLELYVIEIAGKGSPYAFAGCETNLTGHWRILFPEKKMEDLSPSQIKPLLIRNLQEINPDIVVAGAIAFPSGAISVMWAKKNHKGVVIFDDTKVEDVPRGFFVNFIKKRIYRNVDSVVYPASPWDKTAFSWGFKKEQIFYGVDVVDNNFWKLSDEPIILREPKMVVVGRLVKRKNIDFLIRVFQECNTQDYELLIVGEGPEKNNLKCLAESDQNIRFLPFMKQSELRELYKRVSAFIIPSTFDTWGLVINEAMAAGLPVIASSKCGATEVLVKDGVNGYVFNPEDDGTSMKKKLDVFLNLSEEARRELGLASEKIISDWGIDRFAEEMLKAIDYAYRNKKKCVNIWDKLILNLWKGRYRQI
ncbi:hypothetical protein HQ47_08510 [Porphyromonas macacae]|uniref:Glycosyl transferase family 1 domain-containing protein n=1 Tax=Porphyromonas macacae TaxID=28115 RepID=A0A0A2E1Z6_9PORP|nr:glycosyltransferase [Porphyromonas macacae]KGN72898.1 hypothetical protein HQ47_08510 [Porphyromonas macacae]